MKVMLLQDIKGIGKKYEIKEVKEGYARNFLFPKDLAKPATEEVIKWVEMQKEILSQKAEGELKKAQEIVAKVDGLELVISTKVGDKGELFESINAQKISQKLKESEGIEIKKTQINLESPIKEMGEHSVKIVFEHNLEAEIKVIVTEEK